MKRPVLYLATDQRIFQEKKFMKDGENGFFREATLRLCSSLDVEKALFNCLSYLKNSLPAFEMLLTILDLRLGLIHNLAAVDLEGVKNHSHRRPSRKRQSKKSAEISTPGRMSRSWTSWIFTRQPIYSFKTWIFRRPLSCT